jgi:hypothetical protein
MKIDTRIFMLDKMDGNYNSPDIESVAISVDGKQQARWNQAWNLNQEQNLCGNAEWPDRVWRNIVYVPHTASNAEVVIEDNVDLPVSEASWAMSITTVEFCLS